MERDPASPAAASPEDPHLAAALARAERRRARLEELAEMGMTIARELRNRVAFGEEPRREPAPHFATVSRAIRFTLALEAKVEAEILALRNGERPAQVQPAVAPPPRPRWDDIVCQASPDPRRDRLREEVWEAAGQTHGEGPEWERTAMRLHERLIESETYDHLLALPWREAVEAICADLGLAPDWTAWSDERGFERDPAVFWHDPARGWVDVADEIEQTRLAFEARRRPAPPQLERALE